MLNQGTSSEHSTQTTHDSSQPCVMVGMSGGVDSSVAALCLQQQGYKVQGLFMKNWEADDIDETCAAEADYMDAKQVCDRLDIPLFGMNFAQEYWEHVFSHFLEEYKAGRTPNPDILCNKEIKFHAFLEHAQVLGADYIATGHYVRVSEQGGIYTLLKARDENKDQSYFLYTLGQSQLARCLFPLGELQKSHTRKLAARQGFVTHDKKDSTGICFIGERNFKQFLSRFLPAQPGDIVSCDGDHIGSHDGLMYYTLGQRQGLNIGGLKHYSHQPWYVSAKNMQDNQLIVVQGHDHPLLHSHWLQACDLHWVSGRAPEPPYGCSAKIRYRQADALCNIEFIDGDSCRVTFNQPQWAVTPGQSIVFYQQDVCLGGGIIETAERTNN